MLVPSDCASLIGGGRLLALVHNHGSSKMIEGGSNEYTKELLLLHLDMNSLTKNCPNIAATLF